MKTIRKRTINLVSMGHWRFRIIPTKVNKKTCNFVVNMGGKQIATISYSWRWKKYILTYTDIDIYAGWDYKDIQALGKLLKNISDEYDPKNNPNGFPFRDDIT